MGGPCGGERAGRDRPSVAAGGERALPRPLLARGAAGGGGPRGARRRSRQQRAHGRARRRDRTAVPGRGARRQAEAGGRRGGAPTVRGRGRRPGTGKTTTVARIVALLEEQALAAGAAPPLVALAAPTGKAAARLAEAVHGEAARLDVDPAIRARLLELEASTLHRLLGWKPGTHSRFRHDRGNRLPFDVVIVDETSMVSLSLMARLTEAVRREARLILVGDPGQLTSIEAGAVLGDIVGPAAEHPRMSAAVRAAVEEATGSTVEGSAPASDVPVGDGTVVLRTVHRFGGGIERLADAIHAGDADAAIAALGAESITWINTDVGDPASLDLLAPGPRRRGRHRPRRHRGRRVRRCGTSDPRAGRLPRAVRPPPRPPRRRHLDAAHRDLARRRVARVQHRSRGTSAARCS